jgi:CBS domain protein
VGIRRRGAHERPAAVGRGRVARGAGWAGVSLLLGCAFLVDALAARRGDFASATWTAAGLGRAFGQLFIVGGLVLAIVAGAFSGLWLAFIGWFLLAAAEAERALVVADDSLRDVGVWQVTVPNPVTVPVDVSVEELIDDVVVPTRHTAFPVVYDGRPAGIPRLATWPHRRLLVCRDGRLHGLVLLTDVVRVLDARSSRPTADRVGGRDGHRPAPAIRL